HRMLPAEAADFIADKATYERWRAFWADMIGRDEIRPPRGLPVARTDEGFLDAFCSTEEGNYILEDAGFVTQKITVRELPKVADFLFNDLVVPVTAEAVAEKRRLASAIGDVIE